MLKHNKVLLLKQKHSSLMVTDPWTHHLPIMHFTDLDSLTYRHLSISLKNVILFIFTFSQRQAADGVSNGVPDAAAVSYFSTVWENTTDQ